MRFDRQVQLLAGGEHQRRPLDRDAQLVARRPPQQEVIVMIVQLEIARLADKLAQRHFDLRRMLGVVAGGKLHRELGVAGTGDEEVHAVVGPGAALADAQLAVGEPHRARLVGFNAQGVRFGQPALIDRDRALPLAFGPAAPGNADCASLLFGRGVRGDEEQDPGQNDRRRDTTAADHSHEGRPCQSFRDVFGRPCPTIVAPAEICRLRGLPAV